MKQARDERQVAAWCEGKSSFVSHLKADQIARRMRRRKRAAVSVYRCPRCKAWHIGEGADD